MTHNILYIEDNEDNIDIVSSILERAGYAIHISERGPDGIEKAIELLPDLIIVDLHLPGMNGFEITKELRDVNTLKDTKIMMLTADIYSREEGMKAGVDDYMNKPIRRRTFLKKVNEMLNVDAS